MLNLSISTDKTEFPYLVRHPATMALVEFKVKLELVVGLHTADMKLQLRSREGKFISDLIGDDRTLEDVLGVRDQCIVHVFDNNESRNDILAGDAQTFYVIPEEKYATRKDTARKWKQEVMATASTANGDGNEQIVPHNWFGKRCLVKLRDQPPQNAQIVFVGPTHFGKNPGTTQWVGVIYDEAIGKNDGSLDGHRYFRCVPAHGGFVPVRAIVTVLEDVEQQSTKNVDEMQMEVEEI